MTKNELTAVTITLSLAMIALGAVIVTHDSGAYPQWVWALAIGSFLEAHSTYMHDDCRMVAAWRSIAGWWMERSGTTAGTRDTQLAQGSMVARGAQ